MSAKKQLGKILRYVNRFGISGVPLFWKISRKRERAVRLLGFPNLLHLRSDPSDASVFEQIFLWREYENSGVTNPQVIVDLGAHVGFAAVFFATQFPQATIFAVEADPDNYRQLLLNSRGYPNIKPCNLAIWDRSGEILLSKSDAGGWGSNVSESNKSGVKVPAFKFEDFLKQRSIDRVDLLKVDIEGAETRMLDKTAGLWLPRIGTIMIEFHEFLSAGSSIVPFQILLQAGFTCMPRGEGFLFQRPRHN